MSDKQPETTNPQDAATGEQPLADGLYSITPNSMLSVRTDPLRGRKFEVRLAGDLLEKKVSKPRAEKVAAAKNKPVLKRSYVQPKGWQRIGDAFLAGPMNNDPDMDKGSSDAVHADGVRGDTVIGGSAVASASAKLSNKALLYANNLPHSPDLEVSLMLDRRSDRGDMDTAFSWRYWFTDMGRAEARIRLSFKLWRLRATTAYRLQNAAPVLLASHLLAILRHQFVLWKRMGTSPYLRMLKFRIKGSPAAVAVEWPGMSSIRMPSGEYAAAGAFLDSFETPKFEKVLEAGHALGLPTKMIVNAYVQAHLNERQAEATRAKINAKAAEEGVEALSDSEMARFLKMVEADIATISVEELRATLDSDTLAAPDEKKS